MYALVEREKMAGCEGAQPLNMYSSKSTNSSVNSCYNESIPVPLILPDRLERVSQNCSAYHSVVLHPEFPEAHKFFLKL